MALLVQYFVAVVLLFAAVNRLRGQMLASKASQLTSARALAAEALRPVTAAWSAEALRAQAEELAAAERVERWAAAIQEWPFDETILARITTILTAVAATIAARFFLSSFGL